MENENQDGVEVLETTTTETGTVETPTLTPEEIKALQEKAAKVDELESKNKQLFERVKKSEVKEPSQDSDLSQKDLIFIAKADIHEEDIEVVTKHAKLYKIPVSEAYKYLKPVLDVKAEERQTALAAQTKGAGSRTVKVTPESLVESARKGKLPESDADIAAMVKAHVGGKK